MIRTVKLRRWRSYDALDLELGAGTTFVVAANGVGKTSLMLGLAWAVFGGVSKTDARSCIRAGATSAEAEVVLVLPDGRDLSILRTINTRGQTKSSGSVDGTTLDERGITELLERTFGVELDVAARLSLMAGGGQLASGDALELKAHLYKAFGIADLLATAELARKVAKEAEKQRGAIRAAAETREVNQEALEREITAARAAVAGVQQRARELEQTFKQASEAARIAEQLAAHRQQLESYEQEFQALLREAEQLTGDARRDAPSSEPAAWLREVHRGLEIDSKQITESSARERGIVAYAQEALRSLESHAERCPMCLRKMTAEDVQGARATHGQRMRLSAKAAAEFDLKAEQVRAKEKRVVGLLARLEGLRRPVPPPMNEGALERDVALAAQAAAMEALQQCNRELGEMRGNLKNLEGRVAEQEQMAAVEGALTMAYRREAIALASANAFDAAAAEVIRKLIEPIAVEVRRRWEQFFALDGLTLRPDGSVVRIAAGQELGWETLSGGERIWARIVTHLLVLASSTKLPFAWFDEPLEHLDPQLRRTVAATLASTTRHGYPKQLLVTTYEDALARQLAEDTETATVVSVRSAGVRRMPELTPDESVTLPSHKRRAS